MVTEVKAVITQQNHEGGSPEVASIQLVQQQTDLVIDE